MAINKPVAQTEYTEQNIDNSSLDKDFGIRIVEPVKYDGVNLQRLNADNLATKITVVGSVTYLATAAPGTSQATAKWQSRKIDTSTGVVITWADGNSDFDNVATDLTALSYS